MNKLIFNAKIGLMNKEEALEEFIKGLRTAFNNALAYPNRHPYFIKSVEEFKYKIEALLNFLNPIEVNITPESLFIDERYWVKPLTSVELAKILHQRKIKKIEIRPGLSTNELADLLSALALSPKDIIKDGGLGAILKKAKAKHIFVEELDYSGLLNSQGQEESQDIWRYLFKGAVSGKNVDKINEFADDFFGSLKNIRAKDIITDKDLKEDLVKFLLFLKENNKEKFSKCSSELFNYLVNSQDALSDEDMQSLKILFEGLNENDFAQMLWFNLSKEESLDPLFFRFFSTISEGIGVHKIADSLSAGVKPKISFKRGPSLVKNVQSLLLSTDSQGLSPVYRNMLSSLLADISSSEDFYFDPGELLTNYCFVLLNMLDKESDPRREKFIIARLKKEWDFISRKKDYEYIKYIMQVIKSKQAKETAAAEELAVLEGKVLDLIEESIWDEVSDINLDFLAGELIKSRKGSQFYFNKMFAEEKINACGLGLFFKFFPSQLGLFYSEVEAKRNNLELLSRIVRVVSKMDADLSLPILKSIYSFSNEIIKAEILKGMQGVSQFDAAFLLSVLEGNSRTLKKEALKALSRNKESEKTGVRILLGIRNFWGRKNNIILENMSIVGELGLKENAEYLLPFTKMNLFWHASLKKKARNILESLKWKKE